MRRVHRDEIVDHVTYEDCRDSFRRAAMAAKEPRRVHVPPAFTLLFENRLTVRYQIQEMMRVERIVREADIQYEIDTYNELLGGPGALGATLLIEIDDAAERAEKLAAWQGLPERFYLELPDGRRVYARMDPRQADERRISSVHYLQFAVGGVAPLAVGLDFPGLEARVPLGEAQRAALREDLADE